MPAALSTGDPPTRTWWNNLAKAPSSKDLRQAYVQEKSVPPSPAPVRTGRLNSFASAIGFKPKKQSPSLAIQAPPLTFLQHVPTSPTIPVTRPPSKSVSSSSRSRVDSMGPRTPVDSHRDHPHSLLTLSDSDPFTSRPMIAVPVPHLSSDPNHLSAYSNPSVTELVHKKGDPPTPNRISYASSSSNSNYHAVEIPVTEPLRVTKTSDRQLAIKRSIGNMQVKHTDQLHRQTSVTPSMTISPSHSNAGSSSTLLDPHRRSQQEPGGPSRPKLRTRGMTDSGASKTAGFFVEERPMLRKVSRKPSSSDIPSSQEASSSTTRIVIRQASMSRIQPPSAPPTQKLPPPPSTPPHPDMPTQRLHLDGSTMPRRMGLSGRTSATSSPISYASSESFGGLPYGITDRDKRSSQRSGLSHEPDPDSPISFARSKESKTAPSPPRSLKKVLSHQSLARRGLTSPSLPVSPPPPSPPKTAPDSPASPERGLRKQRSFHHPRLPIPPIPLPNIRSPSSANSKIFPTLSAGPDPGSSNSAKRRGSTSATSTSSRRRLFSSSSRPSTSHHTSTTGSDDTFSVFSFRSEADSHVPLCKPWVTRDRKNTTSSFWDEGSSENVPSSPARSHVDYSGPQPIMSRSELAKFDAGVDDWSSELSTTRSRGFSMLSSSTALSEMSRDSGFLSAALSSPPPPSSSRQSSKQVPIRPNGSPNIPSSFPNYSSVKSNHNDQQQQHPQQRYIPSSAVVQTALRTATPDIISLPPPPRRRKATIVSEPDVPVDAIRPFSAVSAAPTTTPAPSLMSSVSRAPSTTKSGSMRSKYSYEKNLHRKSIMRKSSFLDIGDDDDDLDHGTEHKTMAGRMTGSDSFLDLARESFDTVRSET